MVSHINRLHKSRETFGQAGGGVRRPAPNGQETRAERCWGVSGEAGQAFRVGFAPPVDGISILFDFVRTSRIVLLSAGDD